MTVARLHAETAQVAALHDQPSPNAQTTGIIAQVAAPSTQSDPNVQTSGLIAQVAVIDQDFVGGGAVGRIPFRRMTGMGGLGRHPQVPR